jgi:hypothetical protein
MDDETAIRIVKDYADRGTLARCSSTELHEAWGHAVQAIEALAKVRENIDAAKTPADMIHALYAVTEPCATVNGPVQNCKVAEMAAMVEADKWLDPSTPIAEVNAELSAAGGDPEAIGRRVAALVAGLVKKRRQVTAHATLLPDQTERGHCSRVAYEVAAPGTDVAVEVYERVLRERAPANAQGFAAGVVRQDFDPEKVRELIERASSFVLEDRSTNAASAVLSAVRAVRESEAK